MSNVSNQHNITAFVAGESKAFEGQRLAVITYRNRTGADQAGEYKKSKCCSLPKITADRVIDGIDLVMPAVIQFLTDVQDKMIREADLAGKASIGDEELNMASIAAYLSESDAGGNRLTKESVGSWFQGAIADTLAVTLAARMGVGEVPTDAESAQVLRVVDAFKEKFAALAGSKTSYPADVVKSMKKCLAFASEGDAMAAKFGARLDKMLTKPADENLLNML